MDVWPGRGSFRAHAAFMHECASLAIPGKIVRVAKHLPRKKLTISPPVFKATAQAVKAHR